MRVLIGCERSRVVAEAFEAMGHDVLSCDLSTARKRGQHYAGDVFDVIDYPFDLAIFHPPCTHTAVSGAKHFAAKRLDGRQHAAVSFFMKLRRRSAHIPKVAFEHPISIMPRFIGKATQIIQPWQFGHGETKATCLWLRGLPLLKPTQIVEGREARIHHMPPSEDRAERRSETYTGIASAMAQQWGGFALEAAA